MDKRLYRSRNNRAIAGVCAGVGEYFNIDTVVVRIIALILLFSGVGFIVYLVCILIIPLSPISNQDYTTTTTNNNNKYDNNDYRYSESDRYHNETSNNSRNLLGLIIIGIGAFILLQRVFSWFGFDLLGPIAVILIGLLIVFKRN